MFKSKREKCLERDFCDFSYMNSSNNAVYLPFDEVCDCPTVFLPTYDYFPFTQYKLTEVKPLE